MTRPAALLLAAMFGALLVAPVQGAEDVQQDSFRAAQRFLEVSGQNADFVYYLHILEPVIVTALRREHPEISQRCAKETETAVAMLFESKQPELQRIAAEEYAEDFSAAELDRLSAFFGSPLGQRYNQVLRRGVARGVKKPGAAVPFVKGVQAAMRASPAASQQRLEVVLHLAARYMKEDDVTQLRTFFYNGVGKKYQALTPKIERSVATADIGLIKKAGAELRTKLHESGACA